MKVFAILKSLLPKPAPRGSVWITPFLTLSYIDSDMTAEERQVVKSISSLLGR